MKRLLLIAIICLAGAQASLTVDSLSTMEAHQAGNGKLVWLNDESDAPDWTLAVHAAQVLTQERTVEYIAPQTGATVGPLQTPVVQIPYGEPEWTNRQFGETTINLTQAQAGASLALFSESAQFAAHLGQQSVESFAKPHFASQYGLYNGDALVGSSETFTPRSFSDALLVTQLRDGFVHVHINGTIVLEAEFVDFALHSQGKNTNVQSGRTISPVAPGVDQITERFARITLIDAELVLSSQAFEGTFQSALEQSDFQADAPIQVINATGEIGDEFLQGATRSLPPQTLLLAPADSGMVAEIPEEESNNWLGFMAKPVSLQYWWIVLVPLPLLLLLRKPSLEKMEAAIERGQFERASRMANRLLRKDPYEERATMGLAVAESKLGRHRFVVGLLSKWLEEHEPTDGVFHYVLGMAYMDLGKQSAATKEFNAAVRLTPSLKHEIQRGPVVAEHAYA
ncbi:MAG: tetratricopeptide repeat protein [Thermoplasmatota archaeon]